MTLSNAIGYFHWPPIWVDAASMSMNTSELNQEVFRLTLSSGIAFKVLRQGMFIFDFANASVGSIDPTFDWVNNIELPQQTIYSRLKILNAHLLCLYSSFAHIQGNMQLPKMIVTPSNVLLYKSLDDIGLTSHESTVNAQIHFMRCPDAIPTSFDWWKQKRSATLSLTTIEESLKLLQKLIEHSATDALDLVYLFARSCKAYEDHHFDLSLATAWTLTEKLLYFLWENYLNHLNTQQSTTSTKKFINSERKKILTGRDYSASVVAEILSLSGVIPFSLYERLKEVRQDRNNWIHEIKSMNSDNAINAVRLAEDMLRLLYNIELRIPLHLAMLF